ncbi:MAG: dihydrofolate reductase [Clostridia bacterium]|nr:dihydrofolate reductase [Clostridia bacterium]
MKKAFVSAEMDYEVAKELEEYLEIQYAEDRAILSVSDMKNAVADKDILITSYDPVTKEVIDSAPKLGMIVCTRATPVNVDTAYAKEKGIKVSYAIDRNSDSAAEFTIGLMLSVSRKIPFAFKDLHDGKFVAEAMNNKESESVKRDVTWSTGEESPYVTYKGFQLNGHSVGIVGCGGIGRRVGAICHAFGCKVYASDPFLTQDMLPDYITLLPLEELASCVDIMTVHLKDSPQTEKIIDKNIFKKMKKTAFLINTSRGAVIDEEALIEALRHGEIAGAGIDVFKSEPIAKDHPYFEMSDRVVVTPHIAGATWDAITNHTRQFVKDVKHYLAGEELECEYK